MTHFLSSVMTSHGYLALIIFAFIEACCIPISSEITFAWAGVIAATQPDKFSLIGVIVIGTLAEMAGSLTSYAIGRRGGRSLLQRYGKWILVSSSDLDRAERFFAGRGAWSVAVARVLPLVRCFASFGAGVVEVPAGPFAIFSLIGTAIWATALTLLGYSLGDTVTKFFNSFSLVSVALVVILIVGLVAHRVHALRKDAQAAGAAAGQGTATPSSYPASDPVASNAAASDPAASASAAATETASTDRPRATRSGGAHRNRGDAGS